jgi:hypothetical protein
MTSALREIVPQALVIAGVFGLVAISVRLKRRPRSIPRMFVTQTCSHRLRSQQIPGAQVAEVLADPSMRWRENGDRIAIGNGLRITYRKEKPGWLVIAVERTPMHPSMQSGWGQ